MRNIKLNIANQKGATSIEYALLISLIAVVITASVMILGSNLSETYQNIGTAIEAANDNSNGSQQKLSSGKRINSALDDAAGLTPSQTNTQNEQANQNDSIIQSILSLLR